MNKLLNIAQIKLAVMSKFLLISVFMASIVACVPSQQTGTNYSRDEARVVQNVKLGTVIDATPVMIEGTKSGIGGVLGGVVGGLAGSTIDDGATADIAAVIVGAAGAAVGAKAESALTKAQGMEYTIKLDDGEVISVVQALDPNAEAIWLAMRLSCYRRAALLE